MATNITDIVMRITGDNSSAIRAIRQTIEAEKNHINQINQNITALKNQSNGLQAQINAFNNQKIAIDNNINSLKSQNATIQNNIASLQNQKAAITGNTDADKQRKQAIDNNINALNAQKIANQANINSLNNQRTAINNNIGSLNAQKNAINSNINSLNAQNQSIQNNISNLNKQISELSKSQSGFNLNTIAIAAMTAATTRLSQAVASTAMEFDKQMRNINSLVQASEDQFNKFSDSVRQLSKDKSVIDGPTNLAKGMYQLVSSGFEAEKALKMAGVASRAAAAGLTTTETAVTALSALMNGYNRKTLKDSVIFSDQLFKIVDKGVISFEQLSSNLGSVIATASGAKVQFNEVGAAFIELTRAGISASESETAITNLIRSIIDPSKEAKEYAQKLGIELGATALQTKGLSGVMDDLSKSTRGNIEIMSKIIPEARAAKAALTLSKDGAEGFKRALDEMGQSAGATEKAFSQQSKSFAFAMQKMKASIEDLKIEYGLLILQALEPFIKYIKAGIDWLKGLDKETKDNIINAGKWIILLGSLAGAMKILNIAFGVFVGLLSKSNLAIGGAIVFFQQLDKAVNNIKNATDGYNLILKELLENFDIFGKKINLLKGLEEINLFGKVKNYFSFKDTEFNLNQQTKELKLQKEEALKLAQAYIRLDEAKRKALTSDELAQYSQAFTVLSTNSSDLQSRLRNQNIAKSLMSQSKKALSNENQKVITDKQAADRKVINDKAYLTSLEENDPKEKKKKIESYYDALTARYKRYINEVETISNNNDNNKIQKLNDVNQKLLGLAKVYHEKASKFEKGSKDYELALEQESLIYKKISENKNKIQKINDDARKKEEKEQERINKFNQKINDDITKYVEVETKKRTDAEIKAKKEAEKVALKIYQDKKKQDKEALDEALKLGDEELKALEEQTKEFIENDSNSLDERLDLLDQFVEYKKIKYGEDSKEYKEILKKQTDWNKQLRDDEIKSIESFYSEIASGAVNLGNSLGNSTDSLTNFVGSLIESAGRGFNSFLNMSNQLSNIQEKLKKDDITETAANFQTMALGGLSAAEVVSRSIDAMVSNYNKQQQVTVKIERAISNFGANSKEVKDAILESNEAISDNFKALPGVLGDPLSKLTRMFTDFLGLTKSAAQQAREAAFNQDLMKAINDLNKVFDDLDKAEQLRIDMIDDEMTKKSEQLAFDIRIIQKSQESEFLKTAMIQKKYYEFNKWKQEQQSKEVKTVDDSGKKIQEINEKNYKSELSIIDEVYGKKRKKLESEVQKEIDIIQSKNDRIKAIEDERTQSDTDKQKRLQSFNQSLSSNQRSADFYRANEQDFEFGFNGNSNERKKIEADYNAGVINYETYAKKRTEIALKQYQYYNEQAKRISDPKAKQEALDKATQGQEEYYNFIFDKEKEKVENETKQAEKRLVLKQQELATVTELEKSEIAKLDQAYKDSSGMYRDTFVEATQVWTKFAQESINNIDLSNLINKVKNDVAQAKAELNGIKASVNSTVQQAKTTISNTTTVNNAPTAPTQTPVNTSTPSKPLSGVSKGISSVANGISNAASSIAKGISNAAIPYGPTAPDWYGKYTFATNPTETTVKAPDNIGVSDYELKRRKQHDDQAKINNILAKLLKQANWNVSFDNYANQSLSWFEDQARQFGIPLMAKGGVTNGISIAGERGSEAIFNYSDMKSMYDFVKNTAINPSNNYSNQASININYSPVFTGIDLSKTGQVDAMIKNNMNTLKNDILKAQAGR